MKRALALLLVVIFWCFCGCTTFSTFDVGSATNLGEYRRHVEAERQELPTPQLMLVETGLPIRPAHQRQPHGEGEVPHGPPVNTVVTPDGAVSRRHTEASDRVLSTIDNAFERAQTAAPGRDLAPVPPAFPALSESIP